MKLRNYSVNQCLIAMLLAAGCSSASQPATKPHATSSASTASFPTVKTLRLTDEPDARLPGGNGRDTTQQYCGMCHTSRYIVLQPPLSRAVWTTEVTKMRTAFSGPIPQEKVPEILDYLVAVNGAPTTLPAKAAAGGK